MEEVVFISKMLHAMHLFHQIIGWLLSRRLQWLSDTFFGKVLHSALIAMWSTNFSSIFSAYRQSWLGSQTAHFEIVNLVNYHVFDYSIPFWNVCTKELNCQIPTIFCTSRFSYMLPSCVLNKFNPSFSYPLMGWSYILVQKWSRLQSCAAVQQSFRNRKFWYHGKKPTIPIIT